MIPKITRGGQTARRVAYLIGRGHNGEHVNPHIVGGDLLADYGTAVLETRNVREITRYLDEPMHLHDVKVVRGGRAGHVWHCSLSLHPDERARTDAEWKAITERFVSLMELDGDERHAATRTVAFHHGPAANGADHIHVIANVVREDGSVWSDSFEKKRVHEACAIIEREFGLRRVDGHQEHRGQRGYKMGELESDYKRGLPVGELTTMLDGQDRIDPATAQPQNGTRRLLTRIVSSCATAARDEADFVALLRQEGVIPLPRWGKGGRSEVVGYSVAFKTTRPGEKLVPYAGRSLGKDLSLSALRPGWEPLSAALVADAWRSPKQRTKLAPGPELLAQAERELGDLRTSLTKFDVRNKVIWANAARDAAGILNTWSLRTEPTPGPLADAAHALRATADIHRVAGDRRRWLGRLASRAAANAVSVHRPARTSIGLVKQISFLTTQLSEMHTLLEQERRVFEVEAASLKAMQQLQFAVAGSGPPVDAREAGSRQAGQERGVGR